MHKVPVCLISLVFDLCIYGQYEIDSVWKKNIISPEYRITRKIEWQNQNELFIILASLT